jgi:hypothetical protein
MNKLTAGLIQEMSATFGQECFVFQFDIQKHKQ